MLFRSYVILVIKHPTRDYFDCARTLCKTIKMWDPAARVCLITDQPQANDPIYDHYRVLTSVDYENPWANDWQVYRQSPFRETIKLEADMMITSPIAHWWDLFRHRDVVVSTGCRDFYGNLSSNRHYRKFIDQNNLPDVYNAITYWRVSQTAKDFFSLVRSIFENWDQYRTLLKFADDVPSTDLVYAMAAQIIGPELVTMPFASYPRIVHMKRYMIPTQTHNWTEELVWEYNPLRFNTVAQWGAIHYHVKDWRSE
mgnify:CR=1 FL=1